MPFWSRFEATDAHPERWDMSLYTGGPVWAMEWCPTPDGAAATQYVAVACHQGMDDLHHVHKMYSGPGLIQLWDVGKLEYNQWYLNQCSWFVCCFRADSGVILDLFSVVLQPRLPAHLGLRLGPRPRLHLDSEVVSCRSVGAPQLWEKGKNDDKTFHKE